MNIEIPDANFQGVLESHPADCVMEGTEQEIVERALDNAIGSPSLEELAKDKKNVVIISSDHTRPVPSHVTMPILLRRLREANPDIDITILIATGFHRATTHEELVQKYGEKIVNEEKIVVHDSQDDAAMADLGKLPSGGALKINKLAVEADLLIAEGFIESHFFAGFSGGRKSVLPGIASATTVMANHCSEFIASPYARTGILKNNPIHKDMLYAAQQAGLAFILNVVINAEKKVIAAFAGDSEKAHLTGCEYVLKMAEVKAQPADIVVTTNGGYPLDQNIYQSVKGMTAAEANCKKDGVIIMVSACNDGHGGQSFYENLRDVESPRALLDRIAKVPRNETIPDQWEMHMEHAYTFEDALQRAFE